ncbi:uncharacterized protein [Physcomitrium patens]|uniref:uncharacterized protein isoform X2 n=1 Tax=Physcomitrium patens TaxID=3218 RepID=UPI000D17B18D|nr:uncharacterized protein LOC112291082 isoform X2 [Physcomitrium patens]|eukprot:XP_024393830.1 uncharacterized protein LOC112291082 isoform X2 [Physcomitrella patens]
MASWATRCTWVMMLGLFLLAADNFGSVHGLRTRQYHIHKLHAEDSLPSNREGDMDSESLLHNDIVRKLNSGRKLLQRMTPPSKPSVPMSPKREPPAND